MAHSLLMVPVPELDPVVRARMVRRAPEEPLPPADETLAHITLLGPFASLERVASCAGRSGGVGGLL